MRKKTTVLVLVLVASGVALGGTCAFAGGWLRNRLIALHGGGHGSQHERSHGASDSAASAHHVHQLGSRTAATFAGGEASTGWLSLDVYRAGHAYVPGRINGHDVPIMIDTGAGATVIDVSLAARLELALTGDVEVKGTVGTSSARMASGVVIEIGSLRLGPLVVVVLDLQDVAARLGRNPVILGREVFESAVVDLDYPRSRVAFHDPERHRYDGVGRELSLVPVGDKYQVELALEGKAPTRVDVDTGSGNTLHVFDHYTRSAGLLDSRSKTSTCLVAGVGGKSVAKLATLERVSLGDFVLRNVPAAFTQEGRGASGNERTSGNLGARILRRFRVTIDAPHQRIYLEPGPQWEKAFEKNRLGLEVVCKRDALEVLHVAEESAAARAGWRVGDRITAFNGRAVDADYWEAWTAMVDGASGTTVTLRDGAGGEQAVVLTDAY